MGRATLLESFSSVAEFGTSPLPHPATHRILPLGGRAGGAGWHRRRLSVAETDSSPYLRANLSPPSSSAVICPADPKVKPTGVWPKMVAWPGLFHSALNLSLST